MSGWRSHGKSVAITGAGGAIGKALGVALARGGARSILALDISLSSARAASDEMVTASPSGRCTVTPRALDASDGQALRAALTAADAADPLDLFCANAGVLAPGAHSHAAARTPHRTSHHHANLPGVCARGTEAVHLSGSRPRTEARARARH